MLFSLGHGQHTYIETSSVSEVSSADQPLSTAMELSVTVDAELGGRFAYLFPDAPGTEHATDIASKLDALAVAMVEQSPTDDALNSSIPPIYTYLGQFIDHDLTANTDRESGASTIEDDALEPVERQAVTQNLLNLRNGSLRLDSVYGDGPGSGQFSEKLRGLMRFPSDRAQMRLGVPAAITGQETPLPNDPAADLLRIGRIISDNPTTGVTLEELRALDPGLRRSFLDENDELIPQRAVIGDARNDENLVIAQLQVAVLRFHNKTVQWLRSTGAAESDPDALFLQASQLVKWHYQWLIVHDYLKRLCREDILDFVISQAAPAYTEFFNRNRPDDPDRMPMPVEFSVAAYRFGHTMIRSEYDYNRFFGDAVEGFPNLIPDASLNLLFDFTGSSPNPMRGEHSRLPSNWVIEWDRFTGPVDENTRRSARSIDTLLSPPLSELKNEPIGVFKHLGKRNLRRGHKLSVPNAQGCIEEYNRVSGCDISVLTSDELLSGGTKDAVSAGGFDINTPLWFYILKEAEVRENGERLGMLGSAIVADTLVGVIANDPQSYWNTDGSDQGRWHPCDGIRGENGEVIDDLQSFLRFAGIH